MRRYWLPVETRGAAEGAETGSRSVECSCSFEAWHLLREGASRGIQKEWHRAEWHREKGCQASSAGLPSFSAATSKPHA